MRVAPDRPLGLTPASVSDYRELARRRLPRQMFDYIDGGAYEEATMRSNVSDLQEVLLRQVVMKDVSVREQSCEVLGQKLSTPMILGPVSLPGTGSAAEANGTSEISARAKTEQAATSSREVLFSACRVTKRG